MRNPTILSSFCAGLEILRIPNVASPSTPPVVARTAQMSKARQKSILREARVLVSCLCRRLANWSFEMTRPPPELVVAAKARLAELEQEAKKLRDLILFYEDRPATGEKRVASNRARAGSGTRSLSRRWATVLDVVAEHGERGASYDEIIDAAARRGLDVSRNVLRSQMGNFAKRGLVESVSTGVWRAMHEGAKRSPPPGNSERPQVSAEATGREELPTGSGALFTS